MIVVPEVGHIAIPTGTIDQLVVAETWYNCVAAGICAVHLLLQLYMPTGILAIIVGIGYPIHLVVVPHLANALTLAMSTAGSHAGREIRPGCDSANRWYVVLSMLTVALEVPEKGPLLGGSSFITTGLFLLRFTATTLVLDVPTTFHGLTDLGLMQTGLTRLLALLLGLLVEIVSGTGHLASAAGHRARGPLGPVGQTALRIVVAA